MKQDHPPIHGHGKAPHSHDHKLFQEQVKQHGAGHVHHSEMFGKHASGHKLFNDHVAAMCKGGKA